MVQKVIHNHFVIKVFYVDDLCLMAPCAIALQEFLYVIVFVTA